MFPTIFEQTLGNCWKQTFGGVQDRQWDLNQQKVEIKWKKLVVQPENVEFKHQQQGIELN